MAFPAPVTAASSETVRISSDDQSIWAPGPRTAIEWHDYFPIIGGERKHLTVSNAMILDGMGKVTIDGERIKWDPEGAYDSLRNGEVKTITVRYALTDEDGVRETRSIEIEARGTLAGTGYVIPSTGAEFTEAFSFAAVEAKDILQDGHVFDTIKPIDIHWDAMDALKPAIDAVLGGLKAAVDGAQSLYNSASASASRAATYWEDAKHDAALVNDAYVKLGDYYLKNTAAVAAKGAYDAAKVLADALEDAQLERNAKIAAKSISQTAFDAADTAVDLAENALNGAKDALASATSAVTGLVQDIKDAAPSWLSGAIMTLASWVGLDDELRAANRAVDSALNAVQREVTNLSNAKVTFNAAKNALDDAEDAVNSATNSVISAAADLAEELGGKTLGALEAAKNATAAARTEALNDYFDARAEMWAEGILRGENPDLADVAAYNAKVVAAFTELGIAEGAKGAAWLALEAAEFAHDTAYAGIEGTDLTVDAEVSVDLTAQAGLQVDLVLDAGSVDTDIDYKLDTETVLDATADTFTINALATNATTGESVAFETVSPNLQVYAGIAYNVSAEFNMLLDLYGKIAGLEVFDFPGDGEPFTLKETLQMDGWIDLIDFDSTELGSFGVPIPGWVGDILSIDLAFPTIETQGKEAEVDAAVYTDPTGFSMDELTAAILNIAETKLDFSPEFRAMLIKQGMKEDVTSDDLGQAFVDALAAILKTVVGEGDTDGDGVVPIFMIDNKDAGVDGLFHINNIEDVISEIDIDDVGELGFFVAEGESDNVFQVSVDVDQLVATAVNVALGNAPDTTINPLDLSIGLEDLFKKSSIPASVQDKIEKFLKVEFGFEAADFDVRAGANFSQKFALSVNDMDFKVTFEDGTTGTFSADEGGNIVIEDASRLVDTNGDGDIDYTMTLTPDATFFNDTQIGLNLGYTLDFIKAKAELLATLPLDEVFKDFDWSLIGLDEAPELPGVGFDLGLGPLLRMEGDLDVLSADIFEDIFAFNAGSATVAGSFVPFTNADGGVSGVIKIGDGGANRLVGTELDDVLSGKGGNDILIGKNGDDVLNGNRGRDIIRAGGGDDEANGGNMRDILRGQKGDDNLNGGKGNDVIFGNKGDDTVNGGKGADTFVFTKGDGTDHITDFQAGVDVIEIRKGAAGMGGLSFEQIGEDVSVSFANVEIIVEDIALAALQNADNFAF